MQSDAVAAMQNDNSTRGRGAGLQIKPGRRVTERRPNFGGIKDLRVDKTCHPTEKSKEK
jgi:hypothetical protein